MFTVGTVDNGLIGGDSKLKPTSTFILVAFFGATILAALIFRITLGVCFVDESFYIEVARSIIAWGRPFVMNATLAQTSSGMLIPFISFWQAFGIRDQGLVLWMRVVYLIANCACVFVLYKYARTRLDSGAALLVSLLALVWFPFGIPALSYYTEGSNSFLCGLLIYCISKDEEHFVSASRLADALFAIACFAYPPLALPCLVFLILRVVTAPNTTARKTRIMSIVSLAAIGLGLILLTALTCGAENLSNCVKIIRSCTGFYKRDMLQITLWEFDEQYYPLLFLTTAFAAVGVMTRTRPLIKLLSMIAFMAVLITTACLKSKMPAQSHAETILLSLYLIPIGLWYRDFPVESKVAFWCSMLAGLAYTFSSGSGPLTFGIGAYPAVCIGMVEFLHAQRRASSKMLLKGAVMLCTVSVLVLFFSAFTVIYGDPDIDWLHTVRVQSGPYCWLKTTPQKRFLVAQLNDDLKRISGTRETIYIIGPPGWYLCSSLKPLDLQMWHNQLPQTSDLMKPFLRAFYSDHGNPDVIVIAAEPGFGTPTKYDLELLQHPYVQSVLRADYRILVAPPRAKTKADDL